MANRNAMLVQVSPEAAALITLSPNERDSRARALCRKYLSGSQSCQVNVNQYEPGWLMLVTGKGALKVDAQLENPERSFGTPAKASPGSNAAGHKLPASAPGS